MNFYLPGYYHGWWLAETYAANLTSFQLFLVELAPRQTEPNPLTILMRAVNGLRLTVGHIFQPCWSRNRWKSLT